MALALTKLLKVPASVLMKPTCVPKTSAQSPIKKIIITRNKKRLLLWPLPLFCKR